MGEIHDFKKEIQTIMEHIYPKCGKDAEHGYIRVINGRWCVNKKDFNEMTLNERQVLAEKIKS